jgi:glycosyltransferase involved in cell wall biosynthesis
MQAQPVVFTFCDYYLPGYKAGGPLQTIANMVEHLSDRFSFRIVTRDRDLGDRKPYPECKIETWVPVGKAQVLYLPPHRMQMHSLRRIINQTPHEVLYLNSLFSPTFTIAPLTLRRFGLIPLRRTILAPRGELAQSALRKSGTKKSVYQSLARILGLYQGVTWQASSDYEAADIRNRIGRHATVTVAPDLPPPIADSTQPLLRRRKQPGTLKALFLSRIHPVKNLDGALRMLDGPSGRIELNVYGPREDRVYTGVCERLAKTLPPNVAVHFRGPVAKEHVASIMRDHDLLLLPTHGENFGHVILESLLAGCPVLISDRTPWRNLEAAGVGWDLPLNAPQRFHAVLQRLVDADESDQQLRSQRARLYGRQFCLDETMFKQNQALFAA